MGKRLPGTIAGVASPIISRRYGLRNFFIMASHQLNMESDSSSLIIINLLSKHHVTWFVDYPHNVELIESAVCLVSHRKTQKPRENSRV